jgi:succinate-semialdehyde dehydrogenase/glutarate-semialdehyde dehydrogenase
MTTTVTTDTGPAADTLPRADLRARLARRAVGHRTASDWIDVDAPATGAPLGRVPRGTEADIEAAVQAARAAGARWARVPVKERAEVLLRFHDLVLDRQDEVLDLLQLENGKVRVHAFEEVLDTAATARYYAHAGPEHLKVRRRQGAMPPFTQAWEHRHPRGVVGFIAPWNYPLSLGIGDALPALLAGNGVVIKPDQQTPYSALWAVDLLEEAGLPRDVAQVVTGAGSELGGPLIDRVDYVMFTGSTAVGRTVAAKAGERLIECSMELGGKNAMIVLDDAPLQRTVDGGLRACFSNAGQLCISMERMYVVDAIYDTFVPRFAEATRKLKLGGDLGYGADMGCLISPRQLATVSEHVDDARAKGATVLAGGRARADLGPSFYEPTVLQGVTPAMTAYATETFGPVVSIYRVTGVEEAIARANESDYGLNFSVWSADTKRAHHLATRLQAGTVGINEGYASGWGSVDAPMGGFKDSGTGRRHGEHGIVKYTEPQTVSVQRGLPLSVPPGFPAGLYARVMTAGLKLLKRAPGIR